MRAVTDAEYDEREAVTKRQIIARWTVGEITAAEAKAALKKETARLGKPIPGALIAKAVKEHGHLGLRALDIAAAWTLARSAQPRLPRYRANVGRSVRGRRTSTSRRARAPAREPDRPRRRDVARPGGSVPVRGGRS